MTSTSAHPRTTLATCSAAHVLHDGLTDVLYVLLPLLAQAFGLTYAQVGVLRAAARSAMAAFQLPAGLLAERHGERELLALGTLCAGIGFVVLGYAGGFGMILAALFFAGCGHAVQHPLSSAMISHAYPGSGRRAALGTYNFFGDVGKVGIASAVSTLLLAGMHWQQAAFGLGALAIAASVAMLLVLPRRMPHRGSTGRHKAAATPVVGWGIRHRGGFLALCAIEIVDNAARTGFLTFVAFVMLAKGLPDAWAVLSVPLVAAGGMAGKLACGFLAERVGVVRTIAITEAATAAGICLMLFLPGALAFLLLPVIGIALNGTSSALYGSVGDLVEPERVSRAFGLFYTLGSASGVAAPLCYGLLADWIGVRDTMFVLAAVVLLALPLCLALRPAMAAARTAAS